MSESSSIFENVVKDENTLTNLFYNYLKFDSFREALLNLIKIPKAFRAIIKYEDFTTQYSLGMHGRPDLTIINERVAIHFEIKTNDFRSLTENQPKGYLASLNKIEQRKVKLKKLVFLIPENYYYTDAIDEKVVNAPKDVEVLTITWNSIINIIRSNEIQKTEPLFSEYVRFLERYFKPIKIQFMKEELLALNDAHLAKGLDKLLRLLNDTFGNLQKKFPNAFKKSTNSFLDEYGFYLNKGDKEVLFVGLWFYAWKTAGMPICICLCDNYTPQNIDKFKTITTKFKLDAVNIIDEDKVNWICAGIPNSILNHEDNREILLKIFTEFGRSFNLK